MIVAKIPRPMTPSYSARILLCSVAVACVHCATEVRADLLAWDYFNYATTPSSPAEDLNGDGRADLNGLNGGSGFAGSWQEQTGGLSSESFALDYIQAGSIAVPPASGGLWTEGNSLHIYATTDYKETTLRRALAGPIIASEGSSLWFSFLVRKDRVHSTLNPDTVAETENFRFTLYNSDRTGFLRVGDEEEGGSPFSKNYKVEAGLGFAPEVYGYADRGPVKGVSDLVVVKLSYLADQPDTLELFLNPTPGIMPTSPNAMISIPGAMLSEIALLEIEMLATSPASWRTEWSLDEIRIGTTYGDVAPVPEPSSVLLAGFGLGAAGFTRLRRNRAA